MVCKTHAYDFSTGTLPLVLTSDVSPVGNHSVRIVTSPGVESKRILCHTLYVTLLNPLVSHGYIKFATVSQYL